MAGNIRGDIIDKFNTMASLALQTAIKDRLYEKRGKVWEGFLFSYIDERATSGRAEDHSYVSMLKDMYGQRKAFSQIDISSCCTLLNDLDLIRTDREDELVSLIRDKHRNPLQHHVQTDETRDVQFKEDEIYQWFWKTSSSALREFVEVFSISGRERERILSYCDGSSFTAGSSPNHDIQLQQANEYLANGETERGIEILKRLANADHGASQLRLANISLDLGKFRDMFDIDAAKKYAYGAMRAGAPNAGRIYDDICLVAELAEKAETDCLANIKLFELALEGDLLIGDGRYLCEHLIKAEELSPSLDIIPLLKKALAVPTRRGKIYIELCRRGEFEFIKEHLREKSYSIETIQKNITRPFNEDWKSYIELFCIFKTEQYSEELLRKNIEVILKDYNRLSENPPAFFGDFSALLAEAFKALSDLKNEIYCLKRGAELSDNAYCRENYGKYYEEAMSLAPSVGNERGALFNEPPVLYTVNEVFPEHVQKKLAEDFWNYVIDKKLDPDLSPVWFELLNRNVSKISALFAYKSPLEGVYISRHKSAFEKSKIIAAEKERVKRIAELSEILGEKNEAYWDNLSAAAADAEIIRKRKEENEDVIGEESWEFWRNEARVSRRLEEIAARKEKYEKYLSRPEKEVWRSDEAVKEKLRPTFGSLTDELFLDTDRLDIYYSAYLRYSGYSYIVKSRDWLEEAGLYLGNPEKYVADDLNWEFWLDCERVDMEVTAFNARKKHEERLGKHDRAYWIENSAELRRQELAEFRKEREAEEKKKQAEEKKKQSKRKREKALNSLSMLATPFRFILKLLHMIILPKSIRNLPFGIGFAFMNIGAYALCGLLFITLILHRILYLTVDLSDDLIVHISVLVGMIACYYGVLFFFFTAEVMEKSLYSILIIPVLIVITYFITTVPAMNFVMETVSVLDEVDEALFLAVPITQIPLISLMAAKAKEY